MLFLGLMYGSIASFNVFYEMFYLAYEKAEWKAFLLLFEKLAIIGVTMPLLIIKKRVEVVLIAYCLTQLLKYIVNQIIFNTKIQKINFDFNTSWNQLKKLLVQASPYCFSLLLSIIYFYVDILMLGIMRTDEEVGYYNVAVKIIVIIMFLPAAFSDAILPFLAKNFNLSKEKYCAGLKHSYRFMLILGGFIAIFSFIILPHILVYIFSSMYELSAECFRLLSIIIPFRFVNVILGISLTARNRQIDRTKSYFICASFNFLTNLFFISRFGFVGAAITTIFSDILLFLLYSLYNFRLKDNIAQLKVGRKIFISLLITILSIKLLYLFMNQFWIIGILGLLIYVSLLFLFKEITQKDLMIVRRISI
jgi:O-antigen/teichoic acid export membrane protein